MRLPQHDMNKRSTFAACISLSALALCAVPARAQISKIVDNSGRQFFVNADAPNPGKLSSAAKARTAIYMPATRLIYGERPSGSEH